MARTTPRLTSESKAAWTDVDELSAAPPLIAQVKFIIRRLKIADCRELAAQALKTESPSEILAQCVGMAQRCAPGLFDSTA